MFQEIDKRAVVSGCWDFDLASSTFLIFLFFFLIKFNTIPKPRKKRKLPYGWNDWREITFLFLIGRLFFVVGWLVGS